MAWYKLIDFNWTELKFFFKEILTSTFTDFKNTFKNLIIIFKKPKFLFLFVVLTVIIQFFIVIVIILIFIHISIYFHFFLKNFIIYKNIKYDISNKYKYNYYIKDEIYNSAFYTHLYYYFYHFPKLKAFSLNYNFFKNINNKTFAVNFNLAVIFIFVFIFILPFKFLIKFFTGFSYLCIKISSILVCDLIHIINTYKFDSYTALIDNLLLEFDNEYYYPTLNYNLNKKVYFDNKKLLIFNPWFDKFFTDLDQLKKSFKCADKLFKIRFVETSKISSHPIFESFFKKYENKELTALYQSSGINRPIASYTGEIKKDNAVVCLDKGVLGKIGVYDYRPVTIDLSKNSIKISNVPYWKIKDAEMQKKEAFRALCLGLYKKDLIMEDGKIIEGITYNTYIDKLFFLHEKNELNLEAYNSLSYLLDFSHTQVNNDPIKILAWDVLFSKLIILENGEIVLPDLSSNDLPLQIINTLDSFEN